MAGEEKCGYFCLSVRGQKEKIGVLAVDVVDRRPCVCGGEN